MPEVTDAHRPTLAVVGLAIAVVLWGLNTVAIKLIAPGGLVVAVYRLWFAIPLLWATALAPTVRRRLDGAWLRASIVGGVLFSVHQVLFFTSLKLTTVANVAVASAASWFQLSFTTVGPLGALILNLPLTAPVTAPLSMLRQVRDLATAPHRLWRRLARRPASASAGVG